MADDERASAPTATAAATTGLRDILIRIGILL
jgi:hypothetical protein